jgi:hypothetical protein
MSKPTLNRGTLLLGKGGNFEKDIKIIELAKKLRPNERTLIENDFNNLTTNIAWCLDEGDCVTLFKDTDSIINTTNDIHNSLTFDCVGTGSTCYATLSGELYRSLSGYVWQKYNKSLGYVELFSEKNFQGYSVKVFLSHYSPNTIHSICTGWYINDRCKSVKWDKLGELCEFSLLQHPDDYNGIGRTLDFMLGRQQLGAAYKDKQVADLDPYGMNDQVSAFQWSYFKPVRQVMNQAKMTIDESASTTRSVSSVSGKVNGVNQSLQSHAYELSLGEGIKVTSSVSFNSEVAFNLEAGISVSYEPSFGVGGSLSLSYNHGNTSGAGSGKEATTTTTVTSKKTIAIPPRCSYSIDWKLDISTLPPTKFETTMTSWYDIQLKDTVFDESTGLFKRIDNLSGEFKGDYYYKTVLSTSYESLDKKEDSDSSTTASATASSLTTTA